MPRDPHKPNVRYLVSPDWTPPEGIFTEMAWLNTNPDSRVQVQHQDNQGRIKISIRGLPISEISISSQHAEQLIQSSPHRLTKTRCLHAPAPHEHGVDTGRWLIDVYPQFPDEQGRPLMVARLAGPDTQHRPSILTTDISDDPRYHGAWLTRYGRPDPSKQAYLVVIPIRAGELSEALKPPHTPPDVWLITNVEVEAKDPKDAALQAGRMALGGHTIWHQHPRPPLHTTVTRLHFE